MYAARHATVAHQIPSGKLVLLELVALVMSGSGGVDVLWHMKLSMPVLSSIPLSDQIVLDQI